MRGLRSSIKWPTLLVIVTLLLITPLFVDSPYLLHIIILILMYVVMAEAWNILGGYAGQISLGHNAFFAAGAYASALFVVGLGVYPWLGFLAGGVFGILVGVPLGALCFRFRGAYFALATLALSLIIRLVLLNWIELTRGALGIHLKPPPPFDLFGLTIDFYTKTPYYWIIFITALITVLVTYSVVKSKHGLRFSSIREDEEAASALGVNVLKSKLFALALSTFFTGLAGGFYTHYFLYIDPDSVATPIIGLELILATLIGGIGTVLGPVVGAIILIGIREYIRVTFGFLAGIDLLVFGILLIVVVLLARRGIVGYLTQRWKKVKSLRPSENTLRGPSQPQKALP